MSESDEGSSASETEQLSPESSPVNEQQQQQQQQVLVNPRFQCRMYEQEFPEVDDLVMVTVRQIADMGAYVTLAEYNDAEGMVLLSELSRRRIRSVYRLIRVGKNEVVVVLRVDKEKGYIDLSKKRVSPEEVERFEEKYNKSKAVHSIMKHVAEKVDMDLETLYKLVGWPLYRAFGHAFEGFKLALSDANRFWASIGTEVPENVKRELLLNISRRMTPQKLKMRADIEVACFAYEGIEAVKKALAAGESVSTEDIPLKVRLVAPPLYVIISTAMDRTRGLALMDSAISKISQLITTLGGQIVVKMKPKVVSEVEDKELDALMKKSEMENAEVSGDETASD